MAAKTPISAPLGRVSDDDTYPLVDNNDAINALVFRATTAERDKIPLDMRTGCVCVVYSEKKAYKWSGSTWDEYYLPGGVIVADTDGAIPSLRHSIIFDDSFAIQSAGDSGAGVLIGLSTAVKQALAKKTSTGGAMTINGQSISDLTVMPPLQIDGSQDQKRLLVSPQTYEPHHAEGYLAYFDVDEMILGNSVPSTGRRKGGIWADSIAWGANNVDLYAERETKSVILQEADEKDPNATGGVPILCGLHIGFYGKAPQDGTIECKLVNNMNGDILEDASGQPIGIIHHYKKDDPLKPLTAIQVYRAKGAVKATWIPKHTFTDDPVRLEDWAVAGSCMMFQQMGNGEAISPVLNEFQEIVGKPIKVMQKYYGVSVVGNKWALSFDEPRQTITAGSASDSVIGVDFENPTDVSVAIENNLFNAKDTGKLCLFSLAVELSEEDTRNLRGKTVTVRTQVLNRLSATKLCMFVYTGNLKDVTRPVLTGISNDAFTLSQGWDNHDNAFLPEHPEGSFHPIEKDFVIPNAAGLVMFAVLPTEEQSPMDVSIKPIEVDVKDPFTAYEVSINPGSDQLQFQIVNSQFVTNLKIWGVNPTKTNLPMGEKPSTVGKAPVKLFAEEDDAAAYRGGIILEDITEYKIELWLSVSNYFKTKLSADETLRFWVEDEEGDAVADSEASLVLKDGDYTAHLVNWHFDYATTKKNTKLRLYGQSSSKKVGFLTNGTYNAAGVSVDAKIIP
ncbi:hypothetical protein MARILYN_53 [Vibrio phage Marilyn]|nr:hypothetical protein MARILYN_53 [Vibrio phage Marilyn]WCD55576.1 hypothetical protein FAYDEN_53 [Vibrio phage Fayden]WCD55635.1 hypothetical protein BAYBAE_55 [Vibrio phage Baybae]WCD55692.1 hypothetical protein VAITEPHAGE_53 [Vibrio phage Vaitephage]